MATTFASSVTGMSITMCSTSWITVIKDSEEIQLGLVMGHFQLWEYVKDKIHNLPPLANLTFGEMSDGALVCCHTDGLEANAPK
jgi:hypothetical protein